MMDPEKGKQWPQRGATAGHWLHIFTEKVGFQWDMERSFFPLEHHPPSSLKYRLLMEKGLLW